MAASEINAIGAIGLQTRRELILDRLREAISSGQLSAGTHLAEVELSAALGVSRGTLREALRHLQQEGLLTADSRGRLSVRVVNAREVEEIFAVRDALESLALQQICKLEDRSAIVADLHRQLTTAGRRRPVRGSARCRPGVPCANVRAQRERHPAADLARGQRVGASGDHRRRGRDCIAQHGVRAPPPDRGVDRVRRRCRRQGLPGSHMDEAAQHIIRQMKLTAAAAS